MAAAGTRKQSESRDELCPTGGEKNSGVGRYNGRWAIEEFTTPHWISVQHVPCHYPF